MTRLLAFGDDGSTGADVAWLWINEQRWTGWSVEVLSATPPPIGPPPGEAAAEPRPWTPPQPRPVFAEAGFSEVAYLHADADPRYLLATRTRCDLLVVGARGAGTLKALHIGSTTEYLIHIPPVPVLVVRHAIPVRRVVVAVDGSAHARRAAAAAAALPWIGETDVVLVAVRDGRVDVDAALDEVSPLFGRADRRPVDIGRSVPETILAASDGADLVCLGTRGLGGWRRAMAGSTASAVARLAEKAVLLAHAD